MRSTLPLAVSSSRCSGVNPLGSRANVVAGAMMSPSEGGVGASSIKPAQLVLGASSAASSPCAEDGGLWLGALGVSSKTSHRMSSWMWHTMPSPESVYRRQNWRSAGANKPSGSLPATRAETPSAAAGDADDWSCAWTSRGVAALEHEPCNRKPAASSSYSGRMLKRRKSWPMATPSSSMARTQSSLSRLTVLVARANAVPKMQRSTCRSYLPAPMPRE